MDYSNDNVATKHELMPFLQGKDDTYYISMVKYRVSGSVFALIAYASGLLLILGFLYKGDTKGQFTGITLHDKFLVWSVVQNNWSLSR